MRARIRSLPLILILAGVCVLVSGLHFAQAYTGPWELSRPAFGYGIASFRTGPSQYPRQATDANGATVTIARPPTRIASH